MTRIPHFSYKSSYCYHIGLNCPRECKVRWNEESNQYFAIQLISRIFNLGQPNKNTDLVINLKLETAENYHFWKLIVQPGLCALTFNIISPVKQKNSNSLSISCQTNFSSTINSCDEKLVQRYNFPRNVSCI